MKLTSLSLTVRHTYEHAEPSEMCALPGASRGIGSFTNSSDLGVIVFIDKCLLTLLIVSLVGWKV